MVDPKNRKSDYVCIDCGVKYLHESQKSKKQSVTFFMDECGICSNFKPVTHIRVYNYLIK